jgi:hypothetical protein
MSRTTASRFDQLLRSGRFGVFAAPRIIGPLRAAAKRSGVQWHDLDLAGVGDRAGLLRRCAEVLPLPDYFGHNWDALRESLLDLAGTGTPGGVVHWRRGEKLARGSRESLMTALEIFLDAATYWGSTGRAFIVVVDRASAPGVDLPPLR